MDTGKVIDIGAMATRMSVLARALPMRILLVDDDELELELLTDRLAAAGFEVVQAKDGQQALELLDAQWFPLIITDWQMPEMDGIALVEALRSRGVQDTYITMLTMREASLDYERGYAAGVDDYLTKQLPDAELLTRIHTAFNTIALRRSLQEAQQALIAVSPIDVRTGAFSTSETLAKLQAELRRAQRYERKLSVLLIGVRANGSAALDENVLKRVVETVQRTIRTHVDWIGHVEWMQHLATLAVVLPEAAPSDGPKIKERLRIRLARLDTSTALAFDFGLVGLERGGDRAELAAQDLLDVAEHCRACAGRIGPVQLGVVQRSVAVGATIACRHGYAVDSQCPLMLETDEAPPPRENRRES